MLLEYLIPHKNKKWKNTPQNIFSKINLILRSFLGQNTQKFTVILFYNKNAGIMICCFNYYKSYNHKCDWFNKSAINYTFYY